MVSHTLLSSKMSSTLANCSKVFFEESPNLVPAIDSLFLPITRLVVVKKTVAGFRVHVKLVCLPILLQLLLMLGNLLRVGNWSSSPNSPRSGHDKSFV